MHHPITEPAGPAAASEAPAVGGPAAEAGAPGPASARTRALPAPRADNRLLMAVLAAVAAYLVYGVYAEAYDNDIWFLLATGREIVENGIPYTNPFSMHEGMGMVVQQWLSCIIDYGVWCLGGFPALGLLLAALTGFLVWSLLRLGRILRGDSYGGEILLAFICVLLPALAAYLSMRPHIWSMIAYTWVLMLLERYRASGDVRFLAALFPLAVLHVNLHASMAVFDLVIIACYAIPDVLAPLHRRGLAASVRFERAGYGRLPVLAALAVCAAALYANPYGMDGALYLLNSYGSADYNGYIKEMGNLNPTTRYGAFAVASALMGAAGLGRLGLSRMDLPLTALFLGCTLMGFDHVRNVWLMALFSYPLMARASAGWGIPPLPSLRLGRAPFAAAVCAVCAVTLCFCAAGSGDLAASEKDSASTPVKAMDWLADNAADPSAVRVFNYFSPGGYVEWRGFRAFMDARPELWDSAIAGGNRDYYREFVDMAKGGGQSAAEDAVEQYRFDYVIADTGSSMEKAMNADGGYSKVLSGDGYSLWRRSCS